MGLNLAGPAGGPITAVWFGPAGDARLFARTRAGQVFETADFANWTVSRTPGDPPVTIGPLSNVPSPEPGARVQLLANGRGRYYSLGVNLEVSDDDGHTWTNLTAYNGQPVIGIHQRSLAVSPIDSRQMVVANDYGVWRTADGGLSWSGLNEELPNLPMRRLLPSPSPGTIRAEVEGIGLVELPPASAAAHASWISTSGAGDATETQRRDAGKALHTEITALARTATTWFAGSIDGRLWSSTDSGATWNLSPRPALGRIESIATGGETTDDSPRALLGGGSDRRRAPLVFCAPPTMVIIGKILAPVCLPDDVLHGVAVDSVAGVAYVAGDHGIYTAHVDMNNLVPVSEWQKLPGLPEARAMDVRLDHVRNLLYVALDGYGLYATSAPHTSSAVRVLTAADQPAEAAAPGVLLHVRGSGLSAVKSESGDLALVASSASSTQVQVPFEASGSTLALTIESAQGQSRFALPMKLTAPSILVDGDGLPILVDAASGLTLDARNMARPGARIQVFAAGLGKVDPEWRAGVPAPAEDPPVVSAQVGALLNNSPVEVTRATLAPGYVGLYLVEIQLPGLVNAGAADFSLVVNGEASNHVKILLSVD